MEVQLGELAQQQAKDEQVVQFGERMVRDHGQVNEKLMAIAEQKAIQLPQELSGDAQQKYEELQQLSGAEFDKAYMDEMVEDHEKDVELFEQQVESRRGPGSARLCGGDPPDPARAPRTRKAGSVADYGDARRWAGAEHAASFGGADPTG